MIEVLTGMADKKFSGKIHGEPWEALAKGPREALATIWNDYLAEVLQVSPKSERYKILRREIEAAAGFKEVYENWNTLPPESRAVAWRRLMTASRNQLLERGDSCVRCGECCEMGSPTLLSRRPRALSAGSPDLERRLYPQSRREGDQPGGRGDRPEGGAAEGPGGPGHPPVLVLPGGQPDLPDLCGPAGAVPPPELLGRAPAPSRRPKNSYSAATCS